MYVSKNVLLLGPARKLCIRTPETMRNTCSIRHFTCFVVVLIRKDTDEMPPKSSETADGRVIGRGEWLPASRRHTYVVPSWGETTVAVTREVSSDSGKDPCFGS